MAGENPLTRLLVDVVLYRWLQMLPESDLEGARRDPQRGAAFAIAEEALRDLDNQVISYMFNDLILTRKQDIGESINTYQRAIVVQELCWYAQKLLIYRKLSEAVAVT